MADMVVDPQGVRANRRRMATPVAAGHKLQAAMLGAILPLTSTGGSSSAALAR
jgi:hypothetical protein